MQYGLRVLSRCNDPVAKGRQEPIVMSRDRAGQVNRLFLGVKVLEGGPLARGT